MFRQLRLRNLPATAEAVGDVAVVADVDEALQPWQQLQVHGNALVVILGRMDVNVVHGRNEQTVAKVGHLGIGAAQRLEAVRHSADATVGADGHIAVLDHLEVLTLGCMDDMCFIYFHRYCILRNLMTCSRMTEDGSPGCICDSWVKGTACISPCMSMPSETFWGCDLPDVSLHLLLILYILFRMNTNNQIGLDG